VERKGPLAALPSAPGAHIEKLKALGDNAWLDLGSPAPDPKWGKACGRAWSSRAPYAPDLRGAFVFGEGVHGGIKSDGHYMDDLWFYDINAHRWICVYPGIKANGGYAEIKFNADGFEVTPDGHPMPIASMVHAYGMVTYDTDRKLFLSMPCSGGYWGGIKGRWERREELKEKTPKSASPWIYNTVEGHWDRFKTKNPSGPGGFGATLVYVPTVKKSFSYINKGSPICWYDSEAREWTPIKRQGTLTPWSIDPTSCYDSKRDRIWMGGGKFPIIDKGKNALWSFDVRTETFVEAAPKGAPGSTCCATDRAMMNYDSVNDAVVLILWKVAEGDVPGVYVYHPEKNEWETVSERPPALAQKDAWTGFYDPELNVHFMHGAGDSRDNGVMWGYRYRKGGR